MKNFILSICISISLISVCYSATRYWRCSRCGMIYSGETMPKPKKCVSTKYQDFHNLIEMQISFIPE